MEAKHVAILRKNLVYLKEHLDVGEVLDHLYQEGIFTQSEYNRCKQAGQDKCGTVLEILMKKGEDGYKSLCAVLDRAQPHIKQRLDSTSSEEGATSLLFVNQPKLQHEINTLKEKLARCQKELEVAKTAREEDRERHVAELEEEKKKYELMLEKERQEKENVKEIMEEEAKHSKEWEEEAKHSKEIIEQLKSDLSVEKERYQALTSLSEFQEPEVGERTEVTAEEHLNKSDTCVFVVDSVCDESQLMLLPCLHAACKPCLEHQADQLDQGRLLSHCGKEIEKDVEGLPVDYVRRNEAGYTVSKGKKTCTYKDHKQEVDAVTYCQVCEAFFCLNCENSHCEILRNKSHSLTQVHKMEKVPIKEWLKERTCQDHPQQELVLFDNTCKKPVCLLCSKGSHKLHDVEDLQHVHEKIKASLGILLEKHQSKLRDILDMASVVEEHQRQLNGTAEDLKTHIVSVHQGVAVKFLHRHKQLMQSTRMGLEGPKQAVRDKLKTLHAAEESIKRTRDYIQRAMESTTKAELISLGDAVETKSAEDFKMELPKDDIRDTRIRLSFQGQKALEEIIEEFGSLATCLGMDELADSQPTIRDLRREMTELAERQTLTHGDLEKARADLVEHKERLQSFRAYLEGASGDSIYMVAAVEMEALHGCLVSCPAMTLDTERVYRGFQVSQDGLELMNTERRGQRWGNIGGVENYRGTCSRLPIPLPPSPSTLTTPRYWETHTRVRVERVLGYYLLEMSLTQEGEVDTHALVSRQPRNSWAVRVVVCPTHSPGVCTRVYREGEQVGECCTNTMSNTRGTTTVLHYGVVLDVGRGRLAFLDLDRGIVLSRFDVCFTESLRPMFGVCPPPSHYTVQMRLVSGGEIAMTDSKRDLICSALSTT